MKPHVSVWQSANSRVRHISRLGRTLCGILITRQDWFNCGDQEATCPLCLKKAEQR